MQKGRKRYKIPHMVLMRLEQLGIPVRDVLRQAGLGRGLFDDGRAALDMVQYFSPKGTRSAGLLAGDFDDYA